MWRRRCRTEFGILWLVLTLPVLLFLSSIPSFAAPAASSPINVDCQIPSQSGWSRTEDIPIGFSLDSLQPITLGRYLWARRDAQGISFDAVYVFKPADANAARFIFYVRGRFDIRASFGAGIPSSMSITLRSETTICNAQSEREMHSLQRTYGRPSETPPLIDTGKPMVVAYVEWLRSFGATASAADLVPRFGFTIILPPSAVGQTGPFSAYLYEDLVPSVRRMTLVD